MYKMKSSPNKRIFEFTDSEYDKVCDALHRLMWETIESPKVKEEIKNENE